MKKVLLVGNAPLPGEDCKSRPAAGLRTNQFLKSLMGRDDLETRIITVAMPECYEGRVDKAWSDYTNSCKRFTISKDDANLKENLQAAHDEFKPDVIVGVNTFGAYLACGLRSEAALWADLNGWIMAEAQAQAYKKGVNDYLGHYWAMERRILERVDKFSVVSEAQGLALLGELAGAGRLNKESFEYNFVEVVPNGTEWFEGEKESFEEDGYDFGVPEGAFVLLWMGGYNTWVDEEVLFKGVEGAMRKCENLYFVSTGGALKGLDDSTFGRFKSMIEKSEMRERFVFLGWVESEAIPRIYAGADAGINVDRDCVETRTGARNRLNEMMKFGLPVITTRGSEIAGEIERVGAGLVVRSGDSVGLSDAIIRMREDVQGYGERGRRYIRDECNYEKLMSGVMKWMAEAKPAPDRDAKVNLGGAATLRSGVRYLKENGLGKFSKKLWQKLK